MLSIVTVEHLTLLLSINSSPLAGSRYFTSILTLPLASNFTSSTNSQSAVTSFSSPFLQSAVTFKPLDSLVTTVPSSLSPVYSTISSLTALVLHSTSTVSEQSPNVITTLSDSSAIRVFGFSISQLLSFML